MELITSLPIRYCFYLIPLILLLHELEEWNIYEYHQVTYSNKIPGETKLGGRLWLIFLSIIGFIWTVVCNLIPDVATSAIIMMFLIDFSILNAIQHIGLSIKTKKYNPGLMFGGFVGFFIAVFEIYKILLDKILPFGIILVMLFLILPGLIDTMVNSKKGKLPKMVEMILIFSTKLEILFTK